MLLFIFLTHHYLACRGTMTGLALRHMVEHSFSEAQGARPRALNVWGVGGGAHGAGETDCQVTRARVCSNTTVQKHQFFSAQLSSQSNSHIHT